MLAKKGATTPTRLTYDQALDEALCHGWIDGQVRRRDAHTYKQRFTPRRARSRWSRRNVGIVERLAAEGRMHAGGDRGGRAGEGRRALGGRLRRPGQQRRCRPISLGALAAEPAAQAMFEILTSQNRYAVLHRIDDRQARPRRGPGGSSSTSPCSRGARRSIRRDASSPARATIASSDPACARAHGPVRADRREACAPPRGPRAARRRPPPPGASSPAARTAPHPRRRPPPQRCRAGP